MEIEHFFGSNTGAYEGKNMMKYEKLWKIVKSDNRMIHINTKITKKTPHNVALPVLHAKHVGNGTGYDWLWSGIVWLRVPCAYMCEGFWNIGVLLV